MRGNGWMEQSRIRSAFSELVRGERMHSDSLKGCNAEEIAKVEDHFGCSIPASYRDFLSIAGRGAWRLFQGTDIFYPRVLGLQKDAENLLCEQGMSQLLSPDAKVFCMHQGYEMNFFLPGTDDPAVFQFVEGDTGASRPWGSFSDFIETSIQDHLKQWSDLG